MVGGEDVGLERQEGGEEAGTWRTRERVKNSKRKKERKFFHRHR